MSGIGVFITSPANNGLVWVDRRMTVSGQVSLFRGGLTGMSISFPGGVSLPITPPPEQPFGVAGGGWSWTGLIPNTVRPGVPFSFTVSAFGMMVEDPPPPPPGGGGGGGGPIQPFLRTQASFTGEPFEVDGSASMMVWLLPVTPQLFVQQFQTPQLTTGPGLPFTITGSLTEGNGDPYFPKLQYQIGGGAPVGVPLGAGGAWSIALNLPPGEYPLTITGYDDFDSRVDFHKTLTVLHWDQPPDDPNLPKTLRGVPTSASVTSWTRLEPQCAAADISLTSAARLFDPLWLMCRQWQMGEFQGEDAGTPVQARARATNAVLSRQHLGALTATNTQSLRYTPGQLPLETLAERRTMRPVRTTDLRMLPTAVDAGLHFLRMLERDAVGAKYLAAFKAKYPLAALTPAQAAAADPETVRFMAAMAGRAPDARALALALASARQPAPFPFDPALGVAAADVAPLQALVVAWLNLYGGLFSEPGGDAWTSDRLEYALSAAARFSAAPGDDITLTASEFDGGRLDWLSFDANDGLKLDTTGDRGFTAVTALSIPAPVTFKGMPAARFWELEDAKVAWGLLSAGPTDLAHLMMIEYAHSFGNDWFVVPLPLPVGSVTRVESLVVTDTFGVRSLLRPMGDPALGNPYFSMWQPARLRTPGTPASGALPNAFFLAPTLGGVLDGPALEDVLFMRDEMANMAWGIERTIEGGVGAPVSLAKGLAPPVTAPPPAPGAPPRYALSTTIADNWVPLMPAQVDDVGSVRLRRAATLQVDGSTKPHGARSGVVTAIPSQGLFDEEVPREGVRITRRRRMARWIDGSTLVWTALRNDVGDGEGSAGLLFDQVDDGTGG